MRIGARNDVASWVDGGAIERGRAREALILADAVPTGEDWRRFLDRTLAWLGALALAVALGFFIAANWQALGRFGKLALVEVAIVAALVVVAWRGLDSVWGRVALFVAALAVGTLLALVGQTYQTGADTHELFVAWAALILPWALVARQPALWLLLVALLDVAAWLYVGMSFSLFGMILGFRGVLWLILAIHGAALALFELGIARGLAWLDERYAIRLLALGAGAAATTLVVEAIFSKSGRGGPWLAAIAWLALLGGLYWAYRLRRVDLFVLAACVLSGIVVVVAALAEAGILSGPGGLLAMGLVIIGLAGAGAHWLRRLSRQVAA